MHQCHCSTSAQRIRLASSMIAHEGVYGHVSQLSKEQKISRQSLYLLRARGQKGMEHVFYPEEQETKEEVRITQAILTMLVEAHASREGLQRCIEKLLGVHVSTGKI